MLGTAGKKIERKWVIKRASRRWKEPKDFLQKNLETKGLVHTRDST